MSTPRIAIIYDRVNKFGGAERVLQALHVAFPNSTLVTSVYDPRRAVWAKDWRVETSWLQRLPWLRQHHEWLGWLMPLVFESLDLSTYDVVISVTSEAAKGVITKPTQLHLCYCLTPTRYLWSHTHAYEGRHARGLKRLMFSALRGWDYIAAQRPDKMIPISKAVSSRIKHYYKREPEKVIYPPVTLNTNSYMPHTSDYYLVVSRLVPYKRVDLAIQVCLQLGKPLHIVGSGSAASRLHQIAGDSPLISFLGQVDESRLIQEYRGARGLLCPQVEDFGIVSLEAQSYGVPVVSFSQSGVAETLVDQITGVLFNSQTSAALAAAIETAEQIQWDREAIISKIKNFSQERFVTEFHAIVEVCRKDNYGG